MSALAIINQFKKATAPSGLPTLEDSLERSVCRNRSTVDADYARLLEMDSKLLPLHLFNHLVYGLNHNIRSVVLDLVPTPLRDDPCPAS